MQELSAVVYEHFLQEVYKCLRFTLRPTTRKQRIHRLYETYEACPTIRAESYLLPPCCVYSRLLYLIGKETLAFFVGAIISVKEK